MKWERPVALPFSCPRSPRRFPTFCQPELVDPPSLGNCCSDCNRAVKRCASDIRSTSRAIASTADSIRSSRPLIVLSSRGGTGRGSSHLVISCTIGNPSTMVTSPGIAHDKTSWTIRFGSGGISVPEYGAPSSSLRWQRLAVSARRNYGKRIARLLQKCNLAVSTGGFTCARDSSFFV